MAVDTTQLTVIRDGKTTTLEVAIGSNLRETLLANELTPYAWVARNSTAAGVACVQPAGLTCNGASLHLNIGMINLPSASAIRV